MIKKYVVLHNFDIAKIIDMLFGPKDNITSVYVGKVDKRIFIIWANVL